MAAANAAHVGFMYAQQVKDPTTSAQITVADVITKTVNAAQGSIAITPANANSYVKVYVGAGSDPSPLYTTFDPDNPQAITVTVTDPSFTTITPFVHLTTVGGSASGLTIP